MRSTKPEIGRRPLARRRRGIPCLPPAVRVVLTLACAMALAAAARAQVVTHAMPVEETASPDYEVWANGEKVAVYAARTLDPPFAGKEWDFGGPYSFANFDVKGPVSVRVKSRRPLSQAVVRPAAAGVPEA